MYKSRVLIHLPKNIFPRFKHLSSSSTAKMFVATSNKAIEPSRCKCKTKLFRLNVKIDHIEKHPCFKSKY